jgi:hypothetical protein
VKRAPRPQSNGGEGTNSGPSRGNPCTRAIRPIEASKATFRYVRSTSEPAVRFASIGGVRLVATNVFLTSKAAAFFVQGL